MSFFLIETIKRGHEPLSVDLSPFLRLRVYDICGITTYILLWKNKSLSTILDVACWKTPSVFADHYLKDFQRMKGDFFVLGPVVVAGDIVS